MWIASSAAQDDTFTHAQLRGGQLIDALWNTVEKVCPKLRVVAFASIEVVKHVRLLTGCGSCPRI